MTDQSGAFPETLREALERVLNARDAMTQAEEALASAEEFDRAAVPEKIDAFKAASDEEVNAHITGRAALERPRPAPPDAMTYPRPEPLRNEEMPDREWSDYEWVRNQWYLADEHWKEVQADYDAALKVIAQLEQNVRDYRDAPSGGPAGTGAAPPFTDEQLHAAIVWASPLATVVRLTDGEAPKIIRAALNTLGGGAAQPPPSAPAGPWSVRNFASDTQRNGDWNIVANNGALRWCAAHLATEAEANEIRDALNRVAARVSPPQPEIPPK